jgi:nitrous oxide reductase accessory protein NosL
MMPRSIKRLATMAVPLAMLLMLCAGGWSYAAQPSPLKPGSADKCPVCGMFVAQYADFLAQIHPKSGKPLFFDGAKDMFKHYLAMKSEQKTAVTAIYVTSYYNLKPVDAYKAWFVIGSDVNGPMGAELVAFATEADAKEFKSDHKGKRIVRFKDVTAALLKELEREP